MTHPREFAFSILRQWAVLSEPPFIPDRADPVWAELPPKQKAAAFDLLTGIIRWRGALDAVIASRLRQPIDSLDMPVRAILWIGAYQLLLHEQTAAYAAVDTSVEIARRAAPMASGLVNAVLRGITRLSPKRGRIDAALPPEKRLSRHALAIDFQTQLVFNADIFPNPESAPTAHLAAVRSHPAALVEHLRTLLGTDRAADLLLRNNLRPVITLRADARELTLPAAAGVAVHPEFPQFLMAAEGWNAALEALVITGSLSPQDPTAAKPVRQLAQLVAANTVAAPRRILDLCAGLGTKALQLARTFPEARVTATDVDTVKLSRLMLRAKAVKQTNLAAVDIGSLEKAGADHPAPFDVVLIDVPCSNTGVLARRVQSRWRWPTLDHAGLAALQMKLLEQGLAQTSPAGVLVYSTCSIDPAENRGRVDQFLALHADVRMVFEESTLPSLSGSAGPHDGGYFAVLARGRETEP